MNIELFWNKVKQDGTCWRWTGVIAWNGYGSHSSWEDGKTRKYRAHRVAYNYMIGEIPPGLDLDHLCRNRWCVNPYHMDPVTRSVNMKRASNVLRERTHCKNDHQFTPDNTQLGPRSQRLCLACRKINNAKSRATALAKKRSISEP